MGSMERSRLNLHTRHETLIRVHLNRTVKINTIFPKSPSQSPPLKSPQISFSSTAHSLDFRVVAENPKMSASDTTKTEAVEASDTVRSTEASVFGSISSHETLDADQPWESFKEETPMDETRIERDPERGEAEAETESAEGGEGGQPRPLAMVIAETTEEGDSGVPTVGSLVPTPGFHPDWLPANWLVEEHQRASGKRRDKYYYDPQSNRKFRSKREVEDYLNNVSPQTKMARTDAKSTPSSSSPTPKKRFSSRDDDCPTKIHWILNDDSGFSWKPMIGEQEVPEHKRQSWESAFELACQGNNR